MIRGRTGSRNRPSLGFVPTYGLAELPSGERRAPPLLLPDSRGRRLFLLARRASSTRRGSPRETNTGRGELSRGERCEPGTFGSAADNQRPRAWLQTITASPRVRKHPRPLLRPRRSSLVPGIRVVLRAAVATRASWPPILSHENRVHGRAWACEIGLGGESRLGVSDGSRDLVPSRDLTQNLHGLASGR